MTGPGISGNVSVNVTGLADIQRLVQSLNQVVPALEKLAPALNAFATAQSKAGKSSNQVMTAYQQATLALKQQAQAANEAQAAQNRLDRQQAQSEAASRRVANAAAQEAKAQQQAAAAADVAAQKAANLAAKKQQEAESVSGSYFALYQVAAAYGTVSRAAEASVSAPIAAAASYEQAFNQVIRTQQDMITGTSQLTGASALLRTQLEGLAETRPVSFESLSSIAALGGQLGIASGDIKQFTETVSQFAAVSNVSTDQAATAFGRLSNLLGVPASQYNQLASAVADLGVTSAATETEILNVAQGIAASAHAAGLGTEDVLGLSTALASLKVPQYLARGATTRIFADISRAVDAGTTGIQAFSDVMGISAQAALKLEATSPSTFFTDLIKGISDTVASGQSLTSVLDSLGIKNASDITVIQRLSGNYNVLANNIREAYRAYSEPAGSNYLTKASDQVFSGLIAKSKELGNAISNVLANSGAQAVKWLEPIVDLAKGAVDLFSNIPAPISAAVIALGAMLAIFAAYKAVLAISIAGTLAFKSSLSGLSGDAGKTGISFTTLRTAINQTFGAGAGVARTGGAAIVGANEAVAASAGTATTATTALTEAELAKQAAWRAAVGLSAAKVASTEGEAVASGEAAAANVAQAESTAAVGVAAGAAIAPVTGLSTALKFFGGPVFVGITLGVTALATLGSLLSSSSDAAEKAAAAQQAANDAFIASAGGVDALNAAIGKDTEAGTTAAGAYQVLHQSIQDLGDGTAHVTEAWYGLNAAGERTAQIGKTVSDGIYKYADSTAYAGKKQSDLNTNLGLTNDQLKKQDVILGDATKKLALKGLQDAIFGANGAGGILTPAETDTATKAGVNWVEALKAGVLSGADGIKAQLAPVLDSLNNQIAADQAKLKSIGGGIGGFSSKGGAGSGASSAAAQQTQKDIDALSALRDKYLQLTGATAAQNEAVQEATNNSTLYGNTLKALGVDDLTGDVDQSADALNAQSDALKGAADTGKTYADVLSSQSQKLTDLYSNAFQAVDAVGALSSAEAALGKSLADNGNDFSASTEAGRANLAALEDTISAVTQQQGKLVASGQITAQQGAQNIAAYVSNLVNTLATKGVDTSQLDFLVDYVHRITNAPAIWSVSTDVSTGIANLTTLAGYAAQVQNLIAGLDADPNNPYRNTSDQANHGAAPAPVTVAVPAPVPGAETQNYAASTAATLAAAQAQEQYTKDLAAAQQKDQEATAAANAASQAQHDSAEAAKQSGTAQKDAATAANDAAQQRADQAQKDKQYIKDVGDYYATMGSDVTSAGNAVGKTYDSLNKLAQSLAANGTSFSAYTEGGRQNLSALSDALDAYGSRLSDQLQSGDITVAQAGAQYKQYASGIRADLQSAGVPAKEINAYFNAIGANTGWKDASTDVKQFQGTVTQAAAAAKLAGAQIMTVVDGVKLTADELKQYKSDVQDYFDSLTDNAFKFVNAEGAVYESLQKLGASIQANGKSFNTLTDAGRQNFSALGDVVSNFEKDLTARISAGVISASEGSKELAGFTGQIYRELVALGVKATDIGPILKTLGLDPKAAADSNAAVKQYAGVLTAAAKAADAAAKATGELTSAEKVAADYASALNDNFSTQYDRMHALADATDATTKALLSMAQAHQDNIDKVKELTSSNKQLQASIETDNADIATYNRQIAIAQRYGQADKVKDLTAKRDASQDDLSDKQSQLADNTKQIADLKKYGDQLQGNTTYALQNRAAYESLEKTMTDQIDAYAKAGHSTVEVAAYTKQLKQEFINAGIQAGFTKNQINAYAKDFDKYATIVRSTPRTVKTTVSADTSPAQAALSALPSHSSFKTVATADTTAARNSIGKIPRTGTYRVNTSQSGAGTVMNILKKIPNKGDYRVTVTASRSQAVGAINSAVPSGKNVTITASADLVSANRARNALSAAASGINTIIQAAGIAVGVNGITTPTLKANAVSGAFTAKPVYMGGFPGYADGGLLPGTPPANPNQDNMFATGPHGLITVRSREFIQPQPAVDYYGVAFMNAIRNRTFPKVAASGYVAGGQVDGGVAALTAGGNGTLIVQLSREDRRMLTGLANRPVVAAIGGGQVADAMTNRNAAARRAGV